MSSFTKKTWEDRETEFPNRRQIQYIEQGQDSNTSIVNITRDEGNIGKEGTAFSAANMNGLEDRIYKTFPLLISDGGTATIDDQNSKATDSTYAITKQQANWNLNIPYRYNSITEINPDFLPANLDQIDIKEIFNGMADNTYVEYNVTFPTLKDNYPSRYGLTRIYRFSENRGYAEFYNATPTGERSLKYLGYFHQQVTTPFVWKEVITTKNMIDLYKNENGTTGTITLSDTYTNYDFIKIYYSNSSIERTSEFWTQAGYRSGLINLYTNNDNHNILEIRSCFLNFSGTTATLDRNYYTVASSSSITSNNTDTSRIISIKRIVGYKY